MPKITVLPHETLCPQGLESRATSGMPILDNLLENGVEVDPACEKSWACPTCHVILREGYDELAPAEEKEEDMLDKAWGLAPTSRLSCQARVTNADLVVEIPKYTINMVSEAQRK